MKENKLRKILDEGGSTVATRICSAWPMIAEAAASTGSFDYIEFLAEYNPFTLYDFENMIRACELHDTAAIIKIDFQNRAYVAQKALAAGFQGILFTDHHTAEDVEESIRLTTPEAPQYGGRFGYPNNRWIGYQGHLPQMDFAKMAASAVRLFMIEKKEAMDNLEEICSVPGVDMVQFGPSDYSMSCGFNKGDHAAEVSKVQEKMIQIALDHNVQPRVEINTLAEAEAFKSLGVRHFCVGDELKQLTQYWNGPCADVRKLMQK